MQADSNQGTLSELFDRSLDMHEQAMTGAEDWRTEAFQQRTRKAILMLEDATRLVSVLDIFSRNEHISEVSTEAIKYMLLPALLGDLNGKLFDEAGNRREVLAVQEAYFADFLRRCNAYEICNVVIPLTGDEEGDEAKPPIARPQPQDLAKMNSEREAKIARFREKKELEKSLVVLKETMKNANRDEDAVREFYISLVKHFVHHCLEEMESIAMEKPILKHIDLVKSGKAPQAPSASVVKRPFKPIIITKDKLQKEVFGMGYKNLPVLSIEEFYEQRVRDGWFPDPAKVKASSLQDRISVDVRAEEDKEAAEREDKEEREDEAELQRQRNWDEYKDDHKRGEGNRHNKG
jgi:immunoglobulin-binding protein 1